MCCGAGTKEVQSVGDWLETLDIQQYENTLVANGFDDIDFLGANVLEEQDLVEMGVKDAAHRKLLLESCATLPQLKCIGERYRYDDVNRRRNTVMMTLTEGGLTKRVKYIMIQGAAIRSMCCFSLNVMIQPFKVSNIMMSDEYRVSDKHTL